MQIEELLGRCLLFMRKKEGSFLPSRQGKRERRARVRSGVH